MKKFLKQLFCCHAYKATNTEFLRKERRKAGVFYYLTYNVYADSYKCIRCNKEKMEERSVLLI